jgi:hypothetical protein
MNNYKKDYLELKTMLIDDLLKDNNVDVFICSNSVDKDKDNEVCKVFNSKKSIFYKIDEYKEKTQRCLSSYKSKNRKMLFGLEIIDPNDYDVIICTRFECLLLNNMSDYDIDFDKVNFHHKKWNNLVDDNLFLFPAKHYDKVIDFLKNNLYFRGHDFYKMMIRQKYFKQDEINFLSKIKK